MSGEYDEGASFWRRREKTVQSDFLCRPQAVALAGEVRGKRVADLGCGDGYVSRVLAEKGAAVTGVDVSEGMIANALAQEGRSGQGIKYYVGDVTNLRGILQDKDYDIAVSINVIPHLTCAEMGRALAETSRILVSGGSFVLAVPHPRIYVAKPETRWVAFDYGSFVFETDRKVPLRLFAGDGREFSMSCYPHSEEEYERSLKKNGFRIVERAAPLATPEDRALFPDKWGVEDTVPFYLIYACVKKG